MTYNGWKNYQTWNVSLWIQNDEPLYSLAREWVEHQQEFDAPVEYDTFRHTLTECYGPVTPDMVAWSDTRLDHKALNEMLQEIA